MELKYTDEKEKCYGITGMAISMAVWNAYDILSFLDLDATAEESIQFIPTYYFAGNPRVSPKASWQHIFRHFQVSMGMTIGNVMCRSHLLHHRSPTTTVRDAILDIVRQEGADTCALDDDEIQRVFKKSYDYLDRIFAHSGVQQVSRRFAATLASARRLSRAEVEEALAELSGL